MTAQAVSAKIRYSDTEARSGITKTECTKPKETRNEKQAQKQRNNTQQESTAILLIIHGQLQAFQRFSSGKLVLKAVES
jgi:hypothetical protein